MTSRLTITLNSDERAALEKLARREFREIRQQAVVIIRSELEQRGLLKKDDFAAEACPPDAGGGSEN